MCRLELRDHAVAAALDRRQVTTDVHNAIKMDNVKTKSSTVRVATDLQ